MERVEIKRSARMRFSMLFLIFATSICFIDTGQSIEINKCNFPNDTKNNESEKLMNLLSPILGQNFMTEKDSYSYVVSICNDVLKDHELGTVIRRKKNEVVVLGRRNDTRLIKGDNWIVLVFGSGDYITGKDNVLERRTASIYLVCNPESHQKKPQFEMVQEENRNNIFILSTDCVCHFNEGMSGLKIFLIIVSVSFSVYCLFGVAYRRFVHNAQRCHQIPHFQFWSGIGNKLADGCNYFCRCDSEPEVSWNNIPSNFDSGDRDDALLRP